MGRFLSQESYQLHKNVLKTVKDQTLNNVDVQDPTTKTTTTTTIIIPRTDKSLARQRRKQARKHVRDARDFNNIETRAVIFFFCPARQDAKGNSSHSDRNISFFSFLVGLKTYQHPCNNNNNNNNIMTRRSKRKFVQVGQNICYSYPCTNF